MREEIRSGEMLQGFSYYIKRLIARIIIARAPDDQDVVERKSQSDFKQLCLFSVNPIIWFSMLMCNSNYKYMIIFDRIQKFVWKSMQQTLSDIATFY